MTKGHGNAKFYKTIGENIKRERTSRKITRNELASLIGVTSGFMGLVENGMRCTNLENLSKLSEIFGIELKDLIFEKNVNEAADGHSQSELRRKKIAYLIMDLDDPELDYLITSIKGIKEMAQRKKDSLKK